MGWRASTDLAKQALWRSRVETHGGSGQSLRAFSAQQNISADSVRIAVSTMCGWLGGVSRLLKHIVRTMQE